MKKKGRTAVISNASDRAGIIDGRAWQYAVPRSPRDDSHKPCPTCCIRHILWETVQQI